MKVIKILLPVCVVLMLGPALPLCAQSGCVDSPEDPTILLALVGGAGAMVAGIWARQRRNH